LLLLVVSALSLTSSIIACCLASLNGHILRMSVSVLEFHLFRCLCSVVGHHFAAVVILSLVLNLGKQIVLRNIGPIHPLTTILSVLLSWQQGLISKTILCMISRQLAECLHMIVNLIVVIALDPQRLFSFLFLLLVKVFILNHKVFERLFFHVFILFLSAILLLQ
jgi:hypothetical protein